MLCVCQQAMLIREVVFFMSALDPGSPQPLSPRGTPEHASKRSFTALLAPEFWSRPRLWLFFLGVTGALLAGVFAGSLATFLGEIPLVSDLKAYQPSLATKIYDCQGKQFIEFFSEQRTLISLNQVPKPLQQAVIAIEDNSFYQHFGINFSGILRSLMVNFLHKRYQQGGSTITQQLARNMFLTLRKTVERKIKEVILALQIERAYTKQEILEMYLNQIYFGNGAYGVESASRAYFGKHVQDLNLAECAMLAGLPRSPNTYNPYRNLERAVRRRNLVLTQMQRLGFISAEEAEQAKAVPLQLSSIEMSQAPYFVEYVRRQLEDRYGSNAIYKGGLKVYTTLDLNLQQLAQDSMNEGVVDAEKIVGPNLPMFLPTHKRETLQCALVLQDPATGEIKAMIGGRNFQDSKFNRAIQAQRQPGSAFKPFIYAAALTHGFTQADVVMDAPVVFRSDRGEVWKPENFGNKFLGPTTLRKALTHSRNVVTVKLLDKVGIQTAIDTAHRLGISSVLNPYLTLALGASEVNLLELVSAFGSFANHGIRVEPVSILRVEDAEGNVLEEHSAFRQEVLDEGTAYVMTDMLKNVINAGTGYPVRRLGFSYPAAGKTGTTNDYSDAWFIGYTTDYVAGVWLGLDSHRSLGRGITGGMIAAPVWAKLMLKIYRDHAPKDFPRPETVTQLKFCGISGLLANPECGRFTAEGAFLTGTGPTQHCDVHLSGYSPVYNYTSPDGAAAENAIGSNGPDEESGDSESSGTGGRKTSSPGGFTTPKTSPSGPPVKRQVPPML
jgi:penicillin-binding protein 1A